MTPNASTLSILTPSFSTTSTATSPSVDGSIAQSPSGSTPTTQPINGEPNSANATSPTNTADVDPQIIEALKGKDRIYVLKLGEYMEGLIYERRPQLNLQPATSYQRLLVHRCSAYYKLAPDSDPVTKAITVHTTSESRIPSRRLCELVPAESSTQPAFKIMRRADRRAKASSQAGSVTGEDADLSDVEPSESGSLGGRSVASSVKKRMTIEEREAAYAEARSQKGGREKEKDMSASSSSLSLASGSSTNGGSSSVGDADEVGSSPATESEWSGPSVSREKKDGKRSMATVSATSSIRSLRSSAPTFHVNGSNSSRNSRAGSPSHTYGTLYEHHPPPFEPSQQQQQQQQHPMPPPLQGYHPPYMYPYPPPNQPMAPYMQHYGYYPPYGPYPPPQQHTGDSNMHPGEMYPPPPPHMNYGVPYGWPHPPHLPPGQQPMQAMHPPPPPHPQALNHAATGPPPPPPPSQIPQYPPYIPPSYNPQAAGYYAPPPPQHLHPHPPPHPPQQQLFDPSASGNHLSPIMSSRPGPNTGVLSSPGPRNAMQMNNNTRGRGGGPVAPQPRSSWSYGPGIGGGQNYNTANSNALNGDIVGPRLTIRRGPNNNPSSNNRPPHADDLSSTASASTITPSSRRTYPLTNSSQHPSLPPRPDWAVGLKPQASHHQPHHRHQDPRNVSPSTIPRSLNNTRQTQTHNLPASAPLQATDFPPLTSGPTGPERRAPTTTGAWGNAPTRSLFTPGTNIGIGQPAPLANPAALQSRLEDADQGFERGTPKSAELFNPKVVRRPGGNNNPNVKQGGNDKDRTGDAVTAGLAGQVASMTIENQGNSVPIVAVPPRETAVLTMAS
ncbi:hypothetical protein BDN72DRAFT_868369 [Pluteus cervinus]|uniref:Uncharacterized protein n=1 Tax=Pluteus cervinus TaxID=181527 RepID=A0ACD3BBN8_9AGAR|nr:hypothetical protein BDN72DRAFT_868369 [Pluteus cervinus]